MLTKPANIAIVNDNTLFRKALKTYLSEQRNIHVIIESPNISDLVSKLKNAFVHVLVIDVFMLKIGDHEVVKFMKSQYPDIKILGLSMSSDMETLSDLLDTGVYGILSKADEPEELICAITSISEGRIYRNNLFTEVMYWSKQMNAKKPMEAENILVSERDKEVLLMLWEEKSNKQIAEHLFLGVRSVEKIRQDLKEKIGVKSTVGLLKYAIRAKIIPEIIK